MQGLVAGGPETAGGSKNKPKQGAGPRGTGATVRDGTRAYPPGRRGLEAVPSHGSTCAPALPGVLSLHLEPQFPSRSCPPLGHHEDP